MDTGNKARRSWVLFLVFGISLFIFGANCTLGRMLQEEANEQIDKAKTDVIHDQFTEIAQTITEDARLLNNKTATIRAAARTADIQTQEAEYRTQDAESTAILQTAKAPKPPRITKINFPAEIPGNKSTIIGLLYFKDADGDISHVIYRVITAADFAGGTDNNPKLDSGTWKDGAIKIYLWCEGEQYVTLEATIIDLEGNGSNPTTFSFTCKK